jgi:uncharacterized delta-60 repeat protein
MLEKILVVLLISSSGLILSCGAPLQTNPVSPMSLIGSGGQALPPMISSVSPVDNSTGVSTNTQVRILFSENMTGSSLNSSTVIIADSDNNVVSGTYSYGTPALTLIINFGTLANSGHYTVILTPGIMTLSGINLPYQFQFGFTTADLNAVPAPEFSLMSGIYYGSQTTTVTCTEPGAMISYTADGTTPSRTNGTLVSSGASITLTSPQTLRAMAYDTAYVKNDSAVTSAQYNVTAAPPVFTPTGGTRSSDISVAMSSTTSGAIIYYTTDGSTPTTSSAIYTAAIPVAGHGTVMTIRASAAASGLAPSSVTTETYRIMYDQAASPTFSPSGGTHTSDQTVAIASTTPGAVVYYTTNGSTPTPASILYSGPIAVAGNGTAMTIHAIAVATGYLNSPPAAQTYTIIYPPAADVQFFPGGGSFTTDTSVNLSCTTSGAIIYYTTDGSAPTTASAEYSTSIPVSGNGADVTIRAIAIASGFSASTITQQNYKINWLQVTTPTFDMPAGTYGSPLVVTITCATLGATVYYSTDGFTWYSDSSPATATIVSGGAVTLQAYAIAPMMLDSIYASRNYTIDVTPPVVSSVMVGGMTAEGARDVGYTPAIQVAFNEDMDPANVTTNVSINTCSGSLQVSSDSFATCVSMAAAPTTGDNRIFTVNPSVPLDSCTVYQIRVTAPAADIAGNITTGYVTSAGFVTEVSGFVDTSFGSGSGFTTAEVAPSGGYDDDAQAVLVQPDGKILIGGFCDNTGLPGSYDYIMGRYQEDGTLDPSFNGGGISYYNFGSDEYGYDIALQSGGRIILAGSNNIGFHIAGFNSYGNVDSTFGDSSGYTVTDVAQLEYGTTSSCAAYAMAVDSADKIYVAGNAYSSINLNDFALVRYNASGILDPTFGGNGIATVNFNPTRNEEARALAIQTDGKIVVAGYAHDGTKNNFAVARFDTNGNTEMTRVIDFGCNAGAEAVAVYPDGRILMAGHANNQIALARLNSDGTMDSTFVGGGKFMLTYLQAGCIDMAYAVALQNNGKILVTGVSMASNYDVVVARFHVNGSLDTSFGVGGVNIFPIGSGNDNAYDMKLQPVDGKIVVAGSFFNGTNAFDTFLLRLK